MRINEKLIINRIVLFIAVIIIFFLSSGISRAILLEESFEPEPFNLGDILRPAPPDRRLSNALKLVNAGKYDEAIREVNLILEGKPNSAPAYELLGTALIMKGEIDQGLNKLEKAVEIKPMQSSAITKIGDVHMAQKEYEKAREAFLKAINISPLDRRAHQRLGILYEMDNKYSIAVDHYEKGLIGAPPEYVGIKVNLARLYNSSNNFEKTIDLLKGIITRDNRNTTAHIVLGTAYLGLKRIDESISEFRIARSLEPETERAHLSLGIAYREKKNFLGSIKELEQVVKIKPDWSTGHYQMGETLFAMKEYDKALKSYQRAEKLSPNPFLVRKRTADLYLEMDRFEEAISIFKDMVQSEQVNPQIYDLLGSAYQISGQLDLAEKTFQEMCRKYTQNAFASYRTGLFYGFIKNYDMAISKFENGLRISPEDPLLLKALSVAYNQNGDSDEAIETAGKILELFPENLDSKFYLATLCQDAKRDKKAIELYEDIISRKPDHVLALNNLADMLSESEDLRRLDRAHDLAQKAVSAAPENGMVLDTLGWIFYKKKNYQQALDTLEKSVSILPENPIALYHLGAVQNVLGNREESKKNLEMALTISPNFKHAEEARKLLNQ
jgi:tetratricopeptide (TPR) repeat protein